VGGGPGAWTRLPIAQLRHDTAAGSWTLYWADRNRRWHRYGHLDPTPQLDDLLKEINQDPLSMFWGRRSLSSRAVKLQPAMRKRLSRKQPPRRKLIPH
jgi:hypothetical protein